MSAWLTDGFDWLYTNSSARWAKNGYLTTIHLLYCNSRKWEIILIRQPGLLQEQARWDQFSKNGHDDTDFKQCWNNITKYKYQMVITKHKTCQVVVKWTARPYTCYWWHQTIVEVGIVSTSHMAHFSPKTGQCTMLRVFYVTNMM